MRRHHHPVPRLDEAADAARAAVSFVKPRWRGVLHELAFPVSLVAGLWDVLHAHGTAARSAAVVYALSLSTCLGVSALYHRGRWSMGARALLRRLDHAAIYLLIAGTFTPIAVVSLSGWVAVLTLVVVWGGGIVGSVVNSVWPRAPVAVEVGPYVAVGSFGVVLFPDLLRNLPVLGVVLLGVGGALYIAGALIFARKRPDPWPGTFGFHEVFHSLVVTAATLQWVAITHWVLAA